MVKEEILTRKEYFYHPKAFVENKKEKKCVFENARVHRFDMLETVENVYQDILHYTSSVQEQIVHIDIDFKRSDEAFNDWRNKVDKILQNELERCFKFIFDGKSFEENTLHLVLAATYMVNLLSLQRMKEIMQKLVTSTFSNLTNLSKTLEICAFLLNSRNLKYLKAFSWNVDIFWIEAKRNIFKEYLEKLLKENSSNPKMLLTIFKCIGQFGDAKLLAFFQKNYPAIYKHFHSSNWNVFNEVLPQDIDAEGKIVQRVCDPPGQKSVYIPPGDTAKEAYRLSTYLRFPHEVPVSAPNLAASGFFYTGYKDRVKCFICATSVDNWSVGDNPQDSKWHKPDCSLIKGEECGNIRIGADGLFGRRFNQPSTSPVRVGTGPSQTASPSSLHVNDVNPKCASPSSSIGGQKNGLTQAAKPVARSSGAPYKPPELATIPSVHHEQFVKSLDLRRESERLKSFANWPSTSNVSPHALAQSGFFYLGNSDRVQCFSCVGVLRNWNYGDNVVVEHQTHFPSCRMALGTDMNNIPLPPGHRPAPSPQPAVVRPMEHSESVQVQLRNNFPCLYPVNPHMRNEVSRLETFDYRWPATRVRATPQQIAHAGFYFLGDRDRVKCWYCNGGLQNWEPNDEPWTEHAKWFPTCEFVIQNRGPEFVAEIVRLFPNLRRPVLRNGFDVPPSGLSNAASSPVVVIDPKVEMKRNKERAAKEMSSSVVKMAEEMGFSRSAIQKSIERKLTKDNTMYQNFSEIIDDLVNMSGDSDEDTEQSSMDVDPQPKHENTTQSATTGVSSSMEERMKELEDERQCKICLDALADVVFVPCGHLCSCVRCAQSLRKCPICRVKIEKAIKTYLS